MNLGKLWQQALANKGYYAPVGDDGGEGGLGAQGEGGNDDNQGGNEGGNDDPEDKKPSEEEAKLLQEVMKKKEKITSLTESNTALQTQLDELKAAVSKFDGVDLEEFKTLKQQAQQQREQELEGKGNWAELKAELEERHSNEKQQIIDQRETEMMSKVSEINEKLQGVEVQLAKRDAVIEELTIGNAFNSSRFVSDELVPSAAKVRKLYGEHFDVVDGQVHAFDKPRGADKRTLIVDANGQPQTFELALSKIVESDPDVDTIKRASQRSGSDSGSENRQGEHKQEIGSGINRIQHSLNKQ